MDTQTLSRIARVAAIAVLFAAPVQAQLPSANDLLAKARTAMGGEEVIRRHTQMHAVGDFEIPAQGIKGTLELWSMAPDRMLAVVEIPGLGTIRQGYDGKTGWSINPMIGAQLATGKELAQLREQADLHAILHPEKFAKSRETVEKTSFEGKDAFKVKVTPIEGAEYFEFYNATTGDMLGSIRTAETQMGPIESVNAVLEYGTFDGQKLATKMKQSMMGMEQIITLKKVEFSGVDPKVFELPAEIKALVK